MLAYAKLHLLMTIEGLLESGEVCLACRLTGTTGNNSLLIQRSQWPFSDNILVTVNCPRSRSLVCSAKGLDVEFGKYHLKGCDVWEVNCGGTEDTNLYSFARSVVLW